MKKGSKQKPQAIIKQLKTKLKKRNAEIKRLKANSWENQMDNHIEYTVDLSIDRYIGDNYNKAVKELVKAKLAVIALATTLVIAIWFIAIFC